MIITVVDYFDRWVINNSSNIFSCENNKISKKEAQTKMRTGIPTVNG